MGRTTNESTCIEHVRCPQCTKHGGDTSGDNLGVYSDGHSYCFNCRFYDSGFSKGVGSQRTQAATARSRSKFSTTTQAAFGAIASRQKDVRTNIQTESPISWLRKFGITGVDQEKYGIKVTDEHVEFSLYKENEVVLTNTRYFGDDPNEPRYRTKGSRTTSRNTIGDDGLGVIVVEDVISGIAVAKSGYGAYICCGSSISTKTLQALASEAGRRLGVWLDPDQRANALKIALRAQQWGADARPIYTDKDPKYYAPEEIKRIITDTWPT